MIVGFLFCTFAIFFIDEKPIYTFEYETSSLFYYIMACLLSICITACDKEEQLIEDEIPEMIKADLSKRYPSVEILNYQEYSNFSQINVIDKDQNEASIWYVDDIWKMTHTKIADFNQLSLEAQTVFENSKYRFAQFENIYKTEREGMDRSLLYITFSCISGKMLKI
ncbi:MAG: hypothetical protein ACLR6J_18655 [Parabacteroides merdae]